MKRIRTKLMLTLLVVALIPVLPSYYLATGFVQQLFALVVNTTVKDAIQGAVNLSTELHQQRIGETLQLAIRLAAKPDLEALLNGANVAVSGAHQIELYDSQARQQASWSNIPDSLLQGHRDAVPLSPETQEELRLEIDDPEFELMLESFAPDEMDLLGYRDSLEVLVKAPSAQVLTTIEETRYIAAIAPVTEGDGHLGMVVVSRVLNVETSRTISQLTAIRQVSAAVGEYQSYIEQGVRIVFLLLYGFIAFVALLAGYLLSRRLTGPLLRLVEGTRIVAAGNLEHRLEISSKDEIGLLMASFNQMTASIKENQQLAQQRELERQRTQAENERQAIELEKSRQLAQAYRELDASHRQLKEAQTQLLLREKMASLGTLAASVAHEINNPMGAVRSATDVSVRCLQRIEENVAQSPTIDALRQADAYRRTLAVMGDSLQTIGQAGERITAMVQGLRKFAHLDEAEFQLADLGEELENVLALLQPQLSSGVVVETQLTPVARTWCSPGQLNQAFMSVLKNAVEAVERSGRIGIRTEREGDHIAVLITDDGIGIEPERLERIFELNFTTGDSRVRMGSGLALSYRIVEEHQGTIAIDSRPGEGTQVTIRLPIRSSETA
ncbi:MAG: HAMP domain-containing protein [Candidatus Latescibacteria bacterium]|nr:HAMP domain-containing protein [Candidatus Latescibacterota bacterium]